MAPNPASLDRNDAGGIATVLRAYGRLMPQYGVEFVTTEIEADVIAIHAGAYYPTDPQKPVVALCHGLYWTGDYAADQFEYEMNAAVIRVLRRADAVVVPSSWVAKTIQRDMRITPQVIGHGIDLAEWGPGEPKPYVLWNKNRASDVCAPSAVNELAVRFPQQLFLTTFADPNPTPNIKVTGVLSPAEMKPLVQDAQVYLSTTKETYGIGVLEALASGVPVLGFEEGNLVNLVTHRVTGYLARPHDYDDLAAGLEYILDHRNVMAKAALEHAADFTWESAVEDIVTVFNQVGDATRDETVTVVIPCYNYGSVVKRAVDSVLKQTLKPVQVIVVDNNSTDDTRAIVEGIAKKNKRVTYVNCPDQGVAHARNLGIQLAKSEFICCLDADDWVEPTFLASCLSSLLADPTLGVAYTGLRFVKADGAQGVSDWPGPYSFDEMVAGRNCVPTCNVFRKEAWRRTGGYRQRYAPEGAGAEDAALWLAMGAIGYGGKKATNAPLFVYSMGTGRVSGNPDYHEENWRGWQPWVKDEVYPLACLATPENYSHPVYQHDRPVVSVIIPCTAEHTGYLVDALDSLDAQSFRGWEAVVIVDALTFPADFSRILTAYPHVRFELTESRVGAGAARNLGVKHTGAPYLLFLDADDWLEPTALADLLGNATRPGIVYSDYYGHATMDVGEAQRLDVLERLVEYHQATGMAIVRHYAADYDRGLAVRQPELDSGGNFYLWNLITSLVPRKWHQQVGGFDETMQSWEDWDYWLRLARGGAPFIRVPLPLVHYRFTTGNRREAGIRLAPDLIAYLAEKREGVQKMCCGGPPEQPVYIPPPPMSINQGVPTNISSDDYQMIQLVDGNRAYRTIKGPVTKIDYGFRTTGETFLMHNKDIEVLPQSGPRQVIALVRREISAFDQSPVENLDRTDVRPDNEATSQEAPPILIDGIPSIEMIRWLTPTQRVILNKKGILSVTDLLRAGKVELMTVKGMGSKRADVILAEATEVASKYA